MLMSLSRLTIVRRNPMDLLFRGLPSPNPIFLHGSVYRNSLGFQPDACQVDSVHAREHYLWDLLRVCRMCE